jgi:hypothetical protein
VADKLIGGKVMEYIFEIAGSDSTHSVILSDNSGVIRLSCDCTAAENKVMCKHRIAIIKGDSTTVVSKNHQDIAAAVEVLKQCGIYEAWLAVKEEEKNAEKEIKEAKNRVAKKKKALVKLTDGLK